MEVSGVDDLIIQLRQFTFVELRELGVSENVVGEISHIIMSPINEILLPFQHNSCGMVLITFNHAKASFNCKIVLSNSFSLKLPILNSLRTSCK